MTNRKTKRSPGPVTPEERSQILSFAPSRSARDVGGIVGVSHTAVAKVRREAASAPGTPPSAPPAPAAPDPADDVPDVIPDGTPLETIDHWLARTERGAKAAEESGNLAALSSLVSRAAALVEAKRKAQPRPVEDPNDSPDMRAAAEAYTAKLLALPEKIAAELGIK